VITLRFEGGDKLRQTLASMPNRVNLSVQREALKSAADVIQQRASATAPRAPGAPDLADNIRVGNTRPADGSVGVGIGVPRGFFYDWFNEFGTVNQLARPFWRPVIDSEMPKLVKQIAADMWAALIRKGGGSGRSSGGGVGL
jgi:HK97 gp10 family phage protein